MFMKFGDAMRLAGVTNMLIAESGFEKISRGCGTGIQKFMGNQVLHLGPSGQMYSNSPEPEGASGWPSQKKKRTSGFKLNLRKIV